MTREEQWVLEEKYGGDANAEGFAADKARLASGEPVAYVIGWQPFLGLKIHLDSHPLIPRPETEWWVEQLLTKSGHPMSTFRLLDLCAGSGAIGCAMLAAFPTAEVYFGEMDPAHETTIRKNIEANGLRPSVERGSPEARQPVPRGPNGDASRAHIGIGDLFEPFGDVRFDIVACNPPYIPQGRALPRSVVDHEPALALYAGTDGLDLIRRIARKLPRHLAPSGIAWVECDSPSAEAASGLFGRQGFTTEIVHDQYDAPRVIRVARDPHSSQ